MSYVYVTVHRCELSGRWVVPDYPSRALLGAQYFDGNTDPAHANDCKHCGEPKGQCAEGCGR